MRAVVLIGTFAAAALLGGVASAKLPAPSDEAKAKAAEAGAKTAWAGKVDSYLLCKSQDKVAAQYLKAKNPKAAPAASACADPGPFVYPPPAATAVAVAAPGSAAAPAAKAPASAAKKS